METKICRGCSKLLNVSCFHKNKSKPDGLSAQCKGCNKANNARYRSLYQKQLNTTQRKRRKEAREWLYNIKKQSCCVNCGEDDYRVLDFHHKDKNEKEFNITNMVDMPKEVILAEIKKCELLCANCHRIKTFYTYV